MYTFGSQRLLPVKTKYCVLPIILHASKADILAKNVTCIKSEIKQFWDLSGWSCLANGKLFLIGS